MSNLAVSALSDCSPRNHAHRRPATWRRRTARTRGLSTMRVACQRESLAPSCWLPPSQARNRTRGRCQRESLALPYSQLAGLGRGVRENLWRRRRRGNLGPRIISEDLGVGERPTFLHISGIVAWGTYMSFKLLSYLVTGPWMPYAMPRSMNSLAAMFVMTRVAAFWHASVIGGRLTSFKSIAASSTAPPCGRPCVDRQVQVRIG